LCLFESMKISRVESSSVARLKASLQTTRGGGDSLELMVGNNSDPKEQED